MEHLRTSRILDAWVDGEVTPDVDRRALRHVARCGRCRAAAEIARAVKRSLRRRAERQPRPVALVRLRRFADHLGGG